MASDAANFIKKLNLHSRDLQLSVQEANECLSKYEEFNPNKFTEATWTLKNALPSVTEILSLLDDILETELDRIIEWGSCKDEADTAIEVAYQIRLSARKTVASLKGRIKNIEDYWKSLPPSVPAKDQGVVASASTTDNPSSENNQANSLDRIDVDDFRAKKREADQPTAGAFKRPRDTVVNLGFQIDFLSESDAEVRRLFYATMANSKDASNTYNHVLSNMARFFQKYCLIGFNDILLSFTKEINVEILDDSYTIIEIPAPLVEINDTCLHKPIEISQAILKRYRRNAACSKLSEIGFQPTASHKMIDFEKSNTDDLPTNSSDEYLSSDSSSVSDPMTMEEKIEMMKLLKLCQIKIRQPCKNMLDKHVGNHTKLTYSMELPQTKLKILILFPENRIEIIQKIAKHIGLVFIDNVFDECRDEVKNKKLEDLTKKPESKVYSLIQNYVCRHLVLGHNNINVTCNQNIFNNACADVKIVIYEKLDYVDKLVLAEQSHMLVKPQEGNILHYLQAVSYALNECTEFSTSMSVVYQVEKNYYRCQVPAAAIIPYYILKFFCAKKVAESKSEKNPLFDLKSFL